MTPNVMVRTLEQPVRAKEPVRKRVGVEDKEFIYFDNAGTAPLSKTAKLVISECLSEDWCWSNPSSIYDLGRRAKEYLEEARAIVARCINAEPSEIYFVPSATFGINWIIRGIVENSDFDILTSKFEHPAVYECCQHIQPIGTTYCPIDDSGIIDLEEFELELENLPGEYSIASVMLINNEIGSRQPIEKLVEISHKHNVVFMCDCVQGLGKLPIDVKHMGFDYGVFSGHKIGALRSGFVYLSKDAILKPKALIHGGGQERGLVSGTENVLASYVMAKVLEDRCTTLQEDMTKVQKLKQRLVRRLQELKLCRKGTDVVFNGNPMGFGNLELGIVNFSIPEMKLDSEGLMLMLSSKLPEWELPCYVSTGSACSSGSNDASRVLMSLPEMDRNRASKAVRVSLSADNEKWEIDYFVSKLKYILENLN